MTGAEATPRLATVPRATNKTIEQIEDLVGDGERVRAAVLVQSRGSSSKDGRPVSGLLAPGAPPPVAEGTGRATSSAELFPATECWIAVTQNWVVAVESGSFSRPARLVVGYGPDRLGGAEHRPAKVVFDKLVLRFTDGSSVELSMPSPNDAARVVEGVEELSARAR